MGTVWYDSNDYITLGIRPLPEETPEAEANAYYRERRRELKAILKTYKFHYFGLAL